MILHDLVQGSREWHKHRMKYRNASDSPVVMGLSPYRERLTFRNCKVLGFYPEPSESEKYILEKGHVFEANARPFMEALVQDDLYQVVGTEGPWSASFDGLTLTWKIAAEHKMMNDDIRASSCIQELPLHYKVQMEHQARVAGCEAVLFCATNWKGGNLHPHEIKHFWYEPDDLLWQQIVAAWEDFEAEVRFYQSVLASAPADLLKAA